MAIRFAVFIYSCYLFLLEFLAVNFFPDLSIRANVDMDQARTAALPIEVWAELPLAVRLSPSAARVAALRGARGGAGGPGSVTMTQRQGGLVSFLTI
ncbi:hypothetical protein [Herbaspirillum seropedicae]|uniref:hypothetical protein n=1 Tax=Herbaspirillum seropedicae TaxID=964 RepID=UPI003D965B1E